MSRNTSISYWQEDFNRGELTLIGSYRIEEGQTGRRLMSTNLIMVYHLAVLSTNALYIVGKRQCPLPSHSLGLTIELGRKYEVPCDNVHSFIDHRWNSARHATRGVPCNLRSKGASKGASMGKHDERDERHTTGG